MSAKKGCQSPNPRTKIPAVERFNEKWTPEPNTGCHLWTGAADTTMLLDLARSARGAA